MIIVFITHFIVTNLQVDYRILSLNNSESNAKTTC